MKNSKQKWNKWLAGALSFVALAAAAIGLGACGESGVTPCEQHTAASQRVITETTHSIVCKDCGETLSTLAHNFGGWHVREEMTCTADGLEYAICSGCGYEKTQVVKAKGHTEMYVQTAETHTLSCEDCGEALGETAPHSVAKWYVTKAASCQAPGTEFGTCTGCGDVLREIEALPHTPKAEYGGNKDQHWQVCENCEQPIEGTYGDHVLTNNTCACGYHVPTANELVDFVVEVPVGRAPVVLHLSDTQVIDGAQTRGGRDGVYYDFWATDQIEERCFDYLTDTIHSTNPDLILITGDLVYGEFDDNGSFFLKLIAFMESFQIPWAPVFGNHDNESKMGADWQCAQLEAAQYCCFLQRTLTGNGNYSVGIMQGGELIRAFYMLDSNGCGNASDETKANGHTKTTAGFGQDQVAWYTEAITLLHEYSPEAKISFAYHIQQASFLEAYAQYGFTSSGTKNNPINIYTHEEKQESDFGYLGADMKGAWDSGKTIFKGMKALGVDSIFVGHEHLNCASVVYQGVRFQYGQKSSTYDRANYVNMVSGAITGSYNGVADNPNNVPLIGGTVMVLDVSGAIDDAYIYLAENAGKGIDWDQWKEYEVNGLKMQDGITTEAVVTMLSKKFDDTTNAYQVTANSQGKVLFNASLLRGKTTFTFSVYVPSSSTTNLAGMGPFAIRIKPDDATTATVPNVTNASGKYYIVYKTTSSVAATKFVFDAWQTFTVDITNIAATCTEFSILVASGDVIWLKDISFT